MREAARPEFPVPVDSLGGLSAGVKDRDRGLCCTQISWAWSPSGGFFGGKGPISQLAGWEDRVGGLSDVWVRPPRRAASPLGRRDRWGGRVC